jgi:hypothetical protein
LVIRREQKEKGLKEEQGQRRGGEKERRSE